MAQTAFPYQAIRGLPAKTIAARNSATSGPLQTVSWAAASTGDVLTVQGDGTVAFAAVSAGIGGSTGSVDNAILRADGTGGATLQASGWIIADNYTASPNATVNHASIQATGSTTNVSVSIVPKGSGSFSLSVPDGTTAGGNARGESAVDLRTATRGVAAAVASGLRSFNGPNGQGASGTGAVAFGGGASGNYSFAAGFPDNAASGPSSVVFGGNSFAANTASGECAFVAGKSSVASGVCSFAFGNFATASANFAVAIGTGTTSGEYSFGHGNQYSAALSNSTAHGGGQFAVSGDNQFVRLIARIKTTSATPANILITGTSRITIAAGKIYHFIARITGAKSDGSEISAYLRRGVIKRVAGTTTLVTSETLGTDYEDNAATAVSITADDTNDALQIEVTGIDGETWRWQAVVDFGEINFGT